MDLSTFPEFYEKNLDKIVRYAQARVGYEEAEDVAQTAMLRAYSNWERFEDRGLPAIAWVYSIAHNAVIDLLRRRSRFQGSFSLDQDPELGNMEDVFPSRNENEEEICARLDTVGSLKTDPNAKFLIGRAIGFSMKEMGPEGAIKLRMVRSRVRLKEQTAVAV